MAPDSVLRNANIVVADGDRVARKYVSKLLRQFGAQVVPVADGESAIRALRNGTVHLVVLDARVQGLSAMETSRAIRRISRNELVPIFLLTDQRSGAQARGLGVDADEQMAKPFEDAEFMARVRSVLRVGRGSQVGAKAGPGLADQRQFRARVEQELARAEKDLTPFACCMLAVDDFRDSISELGADGADARLSALSDLLRQLTRETDFVARIRTADFGLLLPNTSLAGALGLADRIVREIHRDPGRLGGTKQARVSVGVGTYPDSKMRTVGQLVDSASMAVTQARSVGPNHICCLQQPGYLFRPDLSGTTSRL